MSRMVIAVDGPAAAGKSTVSHALARSLGFRYVDTGAMYRAVGVLAHERGIDFADATALAELCAQLAISFDDRADGVHILVAGRDLSHAIRSADAAQWASKVSAVPAVRERLVALQRAIGARGGVVMEGRDIGTVVFPDAAVKIFLTATPDERAERRRTDLAARGQATDVAVVAGEIKERDQRDRSRVHSPLRPAPDAFVVDTTGQPIDAVVAQLLALVARVENA